MIGTDSLLVSRRVKYWPNGGRAFAPPAEEVDRLLARAREPLGLLRHRTPRPARRGAGAGEAPRGLLVDRQHDRAVDDQPLVRPLLQQVGEEDLDEPLAARDDGGPQPHPDEAVVELIDLFEPRPPCEGRRPLGQDPLHGPDELLAAVAVANEELDRELFQPFRQYADGGDLRVRDMDRLAVERPELRAAQRDVLDDPLQL